MNNPPDMPLPQYIATNGVRLAVYMQGSGIPVVFCHGFPELAFSWRHQLNALADSGFLAIAPDLRGYGLSDRPNGVENYSATKICDDLIGMLDTLGLKKAIFCGHDWGGFIAQSMPLLYPERCLGVISIGIAHDFRPEHFSKVNVPVNELVDKESYNNFMRQFAVPDRLFNANVEAFFNAFLRRGYFYASYIEDLPGDSPEKKMDMSAILSKKEFPGERMVSEKAFDCYVQTFKKTGFTGGIEWYRAISLTIEEIFKRKPRWKVEVPYLYIWPEDDPFNPPGADVGMDDYIHDLEKASIKACGHFVMEDQPEVLSSLIVDWLKRRFGYNTLRS